MRVFIKAYLKYNLGDDLFIDIFLKRYKNIKFITDSNCAYKNTFDSYNNLKIKNDIMYRGINKFIRLITKEKHKMSDLYIKSCDYTVILGGSMFIQNNKSIKKADLENAKKYYIIGSNFGPYNTDEYYKYHKNIFKHAEDVCFREEYSYNLFKELPNIRYASDIVFSLDTSNIKVTNNKKVVISVIECERKCSLEDKEKYENKIIEMSKYFIENGYEVTLMSYCKAEKDEEAIESILSKCDSELKEKINTYYYKGNIEEALNVMGDCQIVVGSRFHANIIGLLLGKTIIPIAYSDKTINVLKDMDFKGKILKVQDIDKFDVDTLTSEDLNYKHDVSYQIKDAKRHFEKLDKVLK